MPYVQGESLRLNWTGYQYRQHDGYGRYGRYMVRALLKLGIDVMPCLEEEINMPRWMQEMRGVRFDDRLTISCLPPYYVQKSPGRHWLLSMTEGSDLPHGWAESINKSGVERVIVPCEHNKEAFERGGVECPVSVVPGGTDPDEFPLRTEPRPERPYTFLALADRGERKGWSEVYAAFFLAFGTVHDTGPDKVRLIIKCRPGGNDLIDFIVEKCASIDPRITFMVEDTQDMRQVYALADCFAIPSRCEGWGMPHREAAMMGIPVITQAYGGTDDGHTHEWALVIEKGVMQPIPKQMNDHLLGQWRVADIGELAKAMRECYDRPESAASLGWGSAMWLRQNQTWDHACTQLLQLLQQEGVLEREMEYA